MKQTGDLGLIPEPELKERMRPGGVWATTEAPVITPPPGPGQGTVRMSCPTEGASIAYTLEVGEKARWKLYSREIRLNGDARVRAKACRLGYRDSAEVERQFRI